MEMPGHNYTMLPACSDDILSLGADTDSLIHPMRYSQVHSCPLGVPRSVPMVLLLKFATMCLESSDGLNLSHF